MKRIIPISAVLFVLTGTVWAGPALDNVVNCYKLDQRTPDLTQKKWFNITPGNPIGQTFVTGPDTITLSRIAVSLGVWNVEWKDDESLVLTLWDSPEKKTKLASFAMPYKWKNWEQGVLMYPLNIPVKSNTGYYFELSVEGGDGRIEGVFPATADYPDGQRYEAGKPAEGDIWFETHVKKPWDKDADYAYYFNHWQLDLPELAKVKAAVEKKDWDTACRELVAYYEGRKDLVEPRIPKKNPKYDPTYDTLVLNMKVKDQDGNIWELGPEWNHYIQWPLRGGVGLTRTGIRKNLVGGYQNTADEKFAKAWNDMILCTVRDQPSPLRAGVFSPDSHGLNANPSKGISGGSMWSALGTAARIGQMWYFYSGVVTSPSFTQDARCAMLFNMVDMMDVLAMMEGGGNWETQMADSLFEIGYTHPELKRSREWFDRGVTTLMENCIDTVFPDGVLQEASINYHGLVTNRFLGLLENSERLKIDIPPAVKRRVEKMIEHIMYCTGPGWKCPATGDTFGPWGGEDLLSRGAKFFNRPDMLWVATHGLEGKMPSVNSIAYKYGGWYVMRSGWDKDSLYMQVHNGPNHGHGHHDGLQMAVRAYGSEMLIDPGIFVYGTPEAARISRTPAHGTICVDGQDMHTDAGPTAWESNSSYDYFDGTNAGYEGLDDVKMRRRIVFLKPDYWVVLDDVTGSGTHKIDSRFVCADGKAQAKESTAVFTDGKNGMVISSPSPDAASVSIDTGERAANPKLKPVPVIKKSCETALPFQTVQAVVPFKGTKAPEVKVESKESADGSVEVKVSFPKTGKADVVTFTGSGVKVVKQ